MMLSRTLDILERAWDLHARFQAGHYAVGPQIQSMNVLTKAGLLFFVGWGRDIDGERDGDVRIWRLTKAGVQMLCQHMRISAEDVAMHPLPLPSLGHAGEGSGKP